MTNTNRNYKIITTCPYCHSTNEVIVNHYNLLNWKYGDLRIDEAFPYLSANERELLLSGLCSNCWNKLFSEEEGEE